MTNEKAFEKFILSDDWQEIRLHAQNSDELAEKVWQAAIAYMQEQSEPVGYLCESPDKVARIFVDKPLAIHSHTNTPLYTTPQRQQPLERLSDEFKDNLYEKYWIKESMTFDELIEVVMDAMQELNK